MSLGARSVPSRTKIIIWAEPVLGQPGIMALSPLIASVFARWSVLEKQLNQLFTLVTDADLVARTRYDELRGWDRRAGAIVHAAASRLDPATSGLLKVVLRLIKGPAAKRDKLAHSVWAVAEGFEADLGLLPADDQHSFAEAMVAAKKAGRCDIPVDNASIYDGSFLVSAADLNALIADLQHAGDRMEALIRGHLFPPFADVTGGNFADYRLRLTEDPEVAARINNVANERRRAGKSARRAQAQARPIS